MTNRFFQPKQLACLVLLFLILQNLPVLAQKTTNIQYILIEVPDGRTSETSLIAIDRIREYSGAITHVVAAPASQQQRSQYDLSLVLGTSGEMSHTESKNDSWLLKTVSTKPLVLVASGQNDRAMLYSAYRLADLLKAGTDLTTINLFFEPKVLQRYVSYGTTTHGRRYHQPSLYYKNLKELPRYGYNGVLIYPGGGTPIGQQASPILETETGSLYNTQQNITDWKNWFREVKKYDLDILMTIPPLIPPGFSDKVIKDYYGGGPEPSGYIAALKSHYKDFLTQLKGDYPEIDSYMFNSTEGATFGRNVRFFGAPDVKRFTNQSYLANNEKIMQAYFDVLSDFFGEDIDKVSFWTHSFGLTSQGIRKMREILFQNPKILILEDDFWNNNLWPYDLPAMKYLPEDLRAEIHTRNPFGMFQIAPDGEYFGGGSVPNAYASSHIRSANEAIDRNARMVIQRIDLHDRTAYGTLFGTMEIVPLAASRQLWSPTPSENEIWESWADRRFGKQASPYVIRALNESRSVLINGLSGDGIDLLGVGSEFIPRLWMRNENQLTRFHLFGKPGRKFVDKTEKDVIYSEEYTAFQMGTHSISINTFRENQKKAMESLEKGLKEIEMAKAHLAESDYLMLKNTFLNGKQVLTAAQLLGELAYAVNILLDNFDRVKDPAARFKEASRNLDSYLQNSTLGPQMDKNITTIKADYDRIGEAALQGKN